MLGPSFASEAGNAFAHQSLSDGVLALMAPKLDAVHNAHDPAAVAALNVTRTADFSIGQP